MPGRGVAGWVRDGRVVEEDVVSYQAGLEGEARLRVTVEFGEAPGELGVNWSPESATAAHMKLEYARIFLVALRAEAERTYVELVDGHPWASVRLPEALAAGEYAIEVDGYGGASWGDGRLDARGRSASFTVTASAASGRE
ncbi:hypothetical protein OHB26_20180 [Nocardia sp. NBC_01503]|uniref:hypothetical protein n=1 Tax=Nocardia sp. NBC_01503 TaxID=2975997 RepID=UPI002E7AC69E|nr:hypothetical protein [Nocardia sp. NBC_01503]WTL29331.1 hypothetical protein OHB26_20180 [Nocardia sp. NBC_01503]